MNSSSDSSDSSSEDDNSTHVLLRPKSRSPSPATARSPRSRSPAIARLHDLMIPGTSRQKSRSPSPRGAKSPRQERLQRPRSRDTTRASLGNKVRSPQVPRSAAVPIIRPEAVGQGFSPLVTIPVSPLGNSSWPASVTTQPKDLHNQTPSQQQAK